MSGSFLALLPGSIFFQWHPCFHKIFSAQEGVQKGIVCNQTFAIGCWRIWKVHLSQTDEDHSRQGLQRGREVLLQEPRRRECRRGHAEGPQGSEGHSRC